MSGVLIIRKIGEILMLFVDLFLKLDYWMFSVTNHSLLYNFNINDLIIYWCGESVFANVLVNARRVSDEKKKDIFFFKAVHINHDFCAKFQISNCYQTNYPLIGNCVKGKRLFTFWGKYLQIKNSIWQVQTIETPFTLSRHLTNPSSKKVTRKQFELIL